MKTAQAIREARAINCVLSQTGEPRTVVLSVLGHLSHDADAAIAAIKLAQFYEHDPVAFAEHLQTTFSRRCCA